MCLGGCPRPWHHIEHPALLDVIGVILKLTASEMAFDNQKLGCARVIPFRKGILESHSDASLVPECLTPNPDSVSLGVKSAYERVAENDWPFSNKAGLPVGENPGTFL